MKTPARIGFLLAPFSAVLLALAFALFLPSLARSGDEAQARGAGPPAAARCQPLQGEDSSVCRQMVELEVRDVIPLPELDTHAVVLMSTDESLMLPIFVDEAAAVAIAFRLARETPPHPLAQDLLDDVVVELGGEVTAVRIEGLEDDVFTGRIVIQQAGTEHALDARPSDSIAMALTRDAPILAKRQVLDEAAISREELDALMGEQPGVGGSGPPPHPLPFGEEEGAMPLHFEEDDSSIRL